MEESEVLYPACVRTSDPSQGSELCPQGFVLTHHKGIEMSAGELDLGMASAIAGAAAFTYGLGIIVGIIRRAG